MNEEVEFALSQILDWKHIVKKQLGEIKKLQAELFLKVMMRSPEDWGSEMQRGWTRKLHENAMFMPLPVWEKDRDRLSVFRAVISKYKPMNRTQIMKAVKGKIPPPLNFDLAAVCVKKRTAKGHMFYCLTPGEVFCVTSHLVSRLFERWDSNGEYSRKFDTDLGVLYPIISNLVPIENDGIVACCGIGALLGHRHILEQDVAGVPKGSSITLGKTFISYEMMKESQAELCMRKIKERKEEALKLMRQ